MDKYFDQDIYKEVLSNPLHSSEGGTRLTQEKGKVASKEFKIECIYFNLFMMA